MNPVVTTRSGEVRGSAIGGVNTFKGIPYAAPPLEANRFLPPQPVEPWAGGEKAHWMRLFPDRITGRRLTRS